MHYTAIGILRTLIYLMYQNSDQIIIFLLICALLYYGIKAWKEGLDWKRLQWWKDVQKANFSGSFTKVTGHLNKAAEDTDKP